MGEVSATGAKGLEFDPLNPHKRVRMQLNILSTPVLEGRDWQPAWLTWPVPNHERPYLTKPM